MEGADKSTELGRQPKISLSLEDDEATYSFSSFPPLPKPDNLKVRKLLKKLRLMGRRTGLVVTGVDSCSGGRGFESE